MTVIDTPRAIRVKTSTGWADLVIQGAPGTNGTNGTNGVGVPVGGALGQALVKKTAADFDTQWATPAAVGVDYIGNWDPAVVYKNGDVVRFNGVDYIAVNPSTNQTPPAAQGVPQAALVKIADQMVGRGQAGDPAAPAATFDFTSIPQTYAHLRIVLVGRCDQSANQTLAIRLNGDTGANYYSERQYGTAGTVAASANDAVANAYFGVVPGTSAPTGWACDYDVLLPGYSGGVLAKSLTSKGGYATGASNSNVIEHWHVQWNNVAAINRITLSIVTANFIAGSRATLYGML